MYLKKISDFIYDGKHEDSEKFYKVYSTIYNATMYSSRIAPINNALVCLAGCKKYGRSRRGPRGPLTKDL